MYQLPHDHPYHHYSSHHHQPSTALPPFPPFYLFPTASSAATTEEPAAQGSERITPSAATFDAHSNYYNTSNLAAASHRKPHHRDPPAGKPSGGGGRSRKSASKKAAAGSHARKKPTEPLRGMGVEQLEEHLRLQEAAASSAAAASGQKKLLLPKFKSAKKPVSRPVLQQDPASFPDEHYGSPVEYGVPVAAAVISVERQRQLQLLQQYQAWVRRVTGAVAGGQPSPYAGVSGAGRSSTTSGKASAGGGSVFLHHHETSAAELSSIPKTSYDLPSCDGPCCVEKKKKKKSFSTVTAAAMVQKNSGVVIREDRFQKAATDEAPLINSYSSNYHRLPAGLMMNSVQNDGVHFTRRDMEAITTTTATGFCRSTRSGAPFYPYRESYYLNQLATLDMTAAHDYSQRKGNSSSAACGNGCCSHGMAMEYYEFFPSDRTTSGEIITKGGSFTKEECSEEEEEVEVGDYLLPEAASGAVGYCGGGGEASCLTTSDHHHHEKHYSSSSAYTYTLASTNPTTTTTTTATSNSISSSLDLSLKLSF